MLDAPNANLIEQLMLKVGACNRYQYRMFLIFMLKWLFAAMYLMSPNFLFYTTDFTCVGDENGQQSCNDWVCSHDD